MDMEVFGIDDLLDFSNEHQLFTSSSTSSSITPLTTTTDSSHHHHHHFPYLNNPTTTFTDDLCIPNDDIAELEWLSNFVDDSFTEFPTYSVTGTINVHLDTSFNSSHLKTKRSRSTTSFTENTKTNLNNNNDTNIMDSTALISRSRRGRSPSASSSTEILPRRCTHCSSEKTPQWQTGPLGPKTLCNACGVRYKSGRLVQEYRPAASPTFVLTQHSNSHHQVMELRRQKELSHQQQQEHEQHQHHRRSELC